MVGEASFSFLSYSTIGPIEEIIKSLRFLAIYVEYQVFDSFSNCTSIRNYYRYNYYYDIFILDVNSNGGNK